MTRLVGVRAVCDGCSAAAAILFCVTHRSVLCRPCDNEQHPPADPSPHQRVALESSITALPFCEYCDDAPATIYCESDGSTLCDKCDSLIYPSNPRSHYRNPISSTLRDRAVELNGKPRPKTPSSAPFQSSEPVTDACAMKLARQDQGSSVNQSAVATTAAVYSHTTKQHHSHQQQEPQQEHRQLQQEGQQPSHCSTQSLPVQSRPQSSSRRRSSKPFAKRKHRREASRPDPSLTPNTSAELATLAPNPVDVASAVVQPLSFPTASPAADDRNLSPPSSPYAAFPPDASATPQAYGDALLIDPGSQFKQNNDRDGSNGGSAIDQAFQNIVAYGSIDLSGDTALEGLNGSGRSVPGSGDSSQRESPEFNVYPHGSRVVTGAPVPMSASATVAAVAAAAAAAAGEMYLLNSVSSGSGSSRDRLSPPLNDVRNAPDPAGVAAAATAAAAAAAECASVAGVDLRSGRVSQQGLLSSKPLQHATETGAETVAGHSDRMTRQQRADNEMWNGSGGVVRREYSFSRGLQEALANRSDGNKDFTPAVVENDDVLRSGTDVMGAMGDLEMPRDEFGMFDSIDLSHFDQNVPGTIPFSMADYRCRATEYDNDG